MYDFSFFLFGFEEEDDVNCCFLGRYMPWFGSNRFDFGRYVGTLPLLRSLAIGEADGRLGNRSILAFSYNDP
ncbi:hypothetical protein V6N11_017276 [Hibiscus sabdariffa]|uniref:Uncharacterized protein n=1 Tax=Hibiscus sabdariffa TaxID=183260 RepID=A0ABR2TXU1_9ROSI